MGRFEGATVLFPSGERVLEAFGTFGEVVVGRVAQPSLHVAEAVLVGHQLDEAFAAIGVELLDVARGERGGVPPNAFVFLVGESVFGVELELVVLEGGEQVDQLEQRFLGGDFAAGNIEHVAALLEVGPVFDFEARDRALRILGEYLGKGGFRVKGGCLVGGGNFDAVGLDRQGVSVFLCWSGLSEVGGGRRFQMARVDLEAFRKREEIYFLVHPQKQWRLLFGALVSK